MKKETHSFGEEDFVVDKDEIRSLGFHNPIVHVCLEYYVRGDLTYEQAMMSAVKFLVTQNKNMFEKLVEYEMKKVKNEEKL